MSQDEQVASTLAQQNRLPRESWRKHMRVRLGNVNMHHIQHYHTFRSTAQLTLQSFYKLLFSRSFTSFISVAPFSYLWINDSYKLRFERMFPDAHQSAPFVAVFFSFRPFVRSSDHKTPEAKTFSKTLRHVYNERVTSTRAMLRGYGAYHNLPHIHG